MQSEDSPLKDGEGLGVDGLPMVGPASHDVPPAPVSLCQGDSQRVGQEQQSQEEAHHVEGGSGPELVPAQVEPGTSQISPMTRESTDPCIVAKYGLRHKISNLCARARYHIAVTSLTGMDGDLQYMHNCRQDKPCVTRCAQ